MKTVLLPFFLFGFSFLSHAQSVRHAWSVHWGNADADAAPAMVTDTSGNIFVAGYFVGTTDFDPGAGDAVYTPTPFTGESYVSKFDSSGAFQWVIILRTTSIVTIKDMVYDPHGFLVLTGDYSGTTDFDPGPGVFSLSSTGTASEVFMLKLKTDGTFVWANSTSGTGQKFGSAVTVDTAGQIFCAGIFTGTGDFDTGPGVETFSATGFVDGFTSKFDAAGQFLWSKHHGGTFQIGINGLVTDLEGNVYFGGAFDDTRDFDPGPDSLILTATGAWDAYFEKFDANGNFQWVRTYSNAADNWVFDMKRDVYDDLLLTGYYSGTLDFDPGPDLEVRTAVLNDTYVAKYNTAGELIWVSTFEGTSYDRGNAMQTDRFGNIYTTGFFGENADFDPGPGAHILSSTGHNDEDDGFLSVLDKNGKFVFAAPLGGTGGDAVTAVAVNPRNDILMAGLFTGKGGFYPDQSAPDSLMSNGSTDVFLVKWNQCLPTTSQLEVASCEATYVSPSGNYVWTLPGTYQDTLVNAAGCDSLITIELHFVVINTDIGIIPELPDLTSLEEDAAYQWVDCVDNFAPVPDATERIFMPLVSGTYAVILTKEGCVDTSECWSVTTATHHPGESAPPVLLPNPFSDCLFLKMPYPVKLSLTIRSLDGRICWYDNREVGEEISFCPSLVPGIYLIEMKGSDKIWTQLVVRD